MNLFQLFQERGADPVNAFDATANRSLRFYREYFNPKREVEVQKERRRFHIRYGGTDFSLNFDRVLNGVQPGDFLEVKSRTWSRLDAERKAALISQLLQDLGIEEGSLVRAEYVDLAV